MREAWRPSSNRTQQVARAVQAMSPGSLQGRIAEAAPVRTPRLEQMEMDTEGDLVVLVEFMQDRHVATSAGPQTFMLSFFPLKESEHMYWNGVYQPAAEWSRKGVFVTVPDPLGLIQPGDEFVVEYAHMNEGGLIPLDGNGQQFVDGEGKHYQGNFGLIAPTADWTFGFLIKLTATPAADRFIFTVGNHLKWASAFWVELLTNGQMRTTIGAIAGGVNNGFNTTKTMIAGNIADGRAHMVFWRWNQATRTCSLWIDGAVVGTTPAHGVGMSVYGTNDMNLGCDYIGWDGGSPPMILDEVVGIPRHASDAELAELLDAWATGDLPGAVLNLDPKTYLRLDETEGRYASNIGSQGGEYSEYGGLVNNDAPALQRGD